ncbi:MAG: 8-oxo-dGTP diphosphatase [Eggerthellaceae bacterium]|nr:8-oxo-dGTP diphosphatase [Eggerthellaceae bacterium]
MQNTSLCYIEYDGKYLMMLRDKKQNDPSFGKWVGVGGKFLEKETPLECCVREIKEETGFKIDPEAITLRGVVGFRSDVWDDEEMYLFVARLPKDYFDGNPVVPECEEGTFAWVDIDKVPHLPVWEGDRIFLEMLADEIQDIRLVFWYEGDKLVKVSKPCSII